MWGRLLLVVGCGLARAGHSAVHDPTHNDPAHNHAARRSGLPRPTATLCRKTSVGTNWDCRPEVPPGADGIGSPAGTAGTATASPRFGWSPLPPGTANPCDCQKTLFTPAAYGGEMHPFPFRSAVDAARFAPADDSADDSAFAPEPVPKRQSAPFRPGGACHNSTRHTRPSEVAAFGPCDRGPDRAAVGYGSCTRALSGSLFFVPEFKLIFCGIPKNGVTGYLQLVRRIMGAADYLSMPYFKEDVNTRRLNTLPRARVEHMLNDPGWTKAVFLRDPAERLLSGYLDKLQNADKNIRGHFNRMLGQPADHNMSFVEFVDTVLAGERDGDCLNARREFHRCHNPHWQPQLYTCSLDRLLPVFSFVGSTMHMGPQSATLLTQLGADAYSTGWSGKDETSCCVQPPSAGAAPGAAFNMRAGGFAETHATHARDRVDAYYSPELMSKVKAAYRMDYEMIGRLGGLGPTVHSGVDACGGS